MAKEKGKKSEKMTKEIELPENVSASLVSKLLLIKGAKGEVKREFKQRSISIKIDDKKIVLESRRGTKEDKKMLGTSAAHIKNMIKGSLQDYVYVLKICSGHFPMNISVSGNKLIVKNFLGEKMPRTLQLKEGADVKIEGDLIYVTSPVKEIAGQVSADIEQLTKRPGYDTRIFQDGVWLISKDGKQLK